MRPRLALVAIVLTAAGCATPVTPEPHAPAASSPTAATPSPSQSVSPSTATDTGVDGTTVEQRCPVARADPPCPTNPVAARLSITTVDDGPVATVDSGPDGHFSVALAPGTYRLRPTAIIGGPMRESAPIDVTVVAGRYTTVTVLIDSGIR